MPRTAPIPNIPAIPGMCPGMIVAAGGGGGGGSGAGRGKGKGGKRGAGTGDGEENAEGGKKNASSCGGGAATGEDGAACPGNHSSASKAGGGAVGEPVDVVTGRVFTVPKVDLELGGPFPLVFHRSYSSFAQDVEFGMGRGWGHSFAWGIREGRRDSVLWTNGAADHGFEALKPGEAAQFAHGWILVRNDDGSYVLDTGNGIWRRFEVREEKTVLAAVSDRYGNTTSLHYERDRLTGLTDSVGRQVRLVWRGPHIAQLDAFDGSRNTWCTFARYFHDEAGHLVRVVDAEGAETRFEYEDGLMLRQVLPTGERVRYRYDRQGRCVETWLELTPGGPQFLADGVSAILADGVTRAKGVLHCAIEFAEDGYSEVANSLTVQRCFGNEHGKLDKAVMGGAVFSRTYDENGNMSSFTDPEGATTTWERDGMGRVLVETDPMGRTNTYVRDPDGHIRRAIDAEGGVTEVHREPNALSWVDPIGANFRIEFDSRGLITLKCAPNGGRIRYEYDQWGNCVRKVDAANKQHEFQYDFWGHCVRAVGPLGQETIQEYDLLGRLTLKQAPDGGRTTYRYDGSGDLVQLVLPSGLTKRWVLAGLGKVVEVHNEDGVTERYRYNRERRLVEVHDGAGRVHRQRLDPQGLLVEEQLIDGRTLHYQYDSAGRVSKLMDNAGNTTESEYDRSGLLIRRTYSDGNFETFSHNGRGELVASETPQGMFIYERNAVGWVVRERQIVGGIEHVVARQFDYMGDVIGRETSVGHRVQLQRDIRGWVTRADFDGAERASFERDASGNERRRLFSGGGRVETGFDALGRMTRRQVYAAKDVGSPSGVLAVGSGGDALVADQGWEYSATSELMQTWDATRGVDSFTYDAAAQLTEHRRTSPAELARVGRAGALASVGALLGGFGYDASRNLYSSDEVREYDDKNRLVRRGEVHFTWNELGQLTRKWRDGVSEQHSTAFEWSSAGMLNAVEAPSQVAGERLRIEFTYDSFARRTAKRIQLRSASGAVVRERLVQFVWDGSYLVHELHYEVDAGVPRPQNERTFYFDDETGEAVAHRTGGNGTGAGDWLFYVNDQVGTPDRLINGRGEIVESFEQGAWGFSQNAGIGTPLRYRGQYYDEETGLCFNRHRYYDADLGRYISPDPLGIVAGLNSYAYAENQPTGFVDPLGLMAFTTITKNKDTKNANSAGLKKQYEGQSSGSPDGGNLRKADDPAITEAVENARKHTGSKAGGCGEVDALHQMAADIRKQREKDGKTHKDPKEENAAIRGELAEVIRSDFKIETKFKPGGKNMNPCPHCAQIFRELGLHPTQGKGPHIVGGDGKTWKGHPVHGGGSPSTQPSSTPPFTGK